MKSARCFYTSVVSVLLSACTTAQPQASVQSPSLSKIEARSMPEDKLKDIVLAQLGEILTEYPRPVGGKKPKNPLTDLWYWTTPRSGQWANICRYQNVRLVFSQDGQTERGADTRVRVVGLDLDELFFLTGDVEVDDSIKRDRDRKKLDDACAARTPLTQNALSAEGEDQIVMVAGWLKRMNAMSDAEFSRLNIDCDIRSDSPLKNCAATLKRQKSSALSSIRSCAPANRDIRDPNCIEADLGSISVSFTAEAGGGLPKKIVVRELIYFADQRID